MRHATRVERFHISQQPGKKVLRQPVSISLLFDGYAFNQSVSYTR